MPPPSSPSPRTTTPPTNVAAAAATRSDAYTITATIVTAATSQPPPPSHRPVTTVVTTPLGKGAFEFRYNSLGVFGFRVNNTQVAFGSGLSTEYGAFGCYKHQRVRLAVVHRVRIVLSVKDKLDYLEQSIPLAPVSAQAGQQVAPEALAAHVAWVKGSKEIVGLMLMTMKPDIQQNLENLSAYDMLQELKTLFSQQVERELLQTVRDFHSCKQEEGSMYVVSNKRAKLKLDSALLWYCHLGHISKKRIEKLQHDGLLNSTDLRAFKKCVSYMSEKMAQKPYTHQVERAKDLLGLIHTDVCGLFRTVSRQGTSYFVTFTDDFSRYGYVYLLKYKHEVFETFRVFQKEVENQLGKTIKSLRSDRGSEYMSQESLDHLKEHGIISHRTPPYTPQHNGVAERKNRTLLDMVRSMMSQTTLPKSFWDYALETVARILSMVPTKKVGKTPYEDTQRKQWVILSSTHPRTKSTKTRHAPDRMCLYVDAEEHELGDLGEPANYKAALLDPESGKCLNAMNVEMQFMKDDEVWDLVDLPPNGKTVGSKWLFKKKTDVDGAIHIFKAHLVVKGITQTDKSRRLIGLCQSAYIEKILKRFHIENSKRGSIPMQEKLKLSKSQGASTHDELKRMQNVPYASAMGSIMYVVRCTRPDVAFAQNIASRFQHNPSDLYWTTVKNIMKYLMNTKDMFLVYGGDIKRELRVSCYTDAGYLTDDDDLKSQTGYVFILNGGVVNWKSTKQSIFATSSAEAEYIAAYDASNEVVWVRNFISGLGVVSTIKEHINMYCDNTRAITIANESRITNGARHFRAKVHYLHEVIEYGDIKLEKVHTYDNLVDPFTEALAFPKHSKHTRNIEMLPASSLM
nr:retrotransposon protein, putative, Ty1-copia subclass [Tanacetum cinerariifolium]